MTKKSEEIMEILEAYDLTRCAWSAGPVVGMRQTYLFCAWLAWSRYRVILPTWERTLGSLLVCLERTLRKLGAVPTYALTDNERTVSVDRVAGVPVRHPEVVAFRRHYGLRVVTCAPADPESKGGSESTVRVAEAELVPTQYNLLKAYDSFSALLGACEDLCHELNGREHRESWRVPTVALQEELALMHRLPLEPYTAALGETRGVRHDQTIRWGSVRYSLPKAWVARRSGAGSRARSWSWSAATRAACARSCVTSSRCRAGRASWTSATPTIPTAAPPCSPSRGPRARLSATSSPSARGPRSG